jgi:DNA-binding NarL/FixJ family response regulator
MNARKEVSRLEHPIRLLIAEDQPLMRRGLRTVLDLEPGFVVVGEAPDGREAVEQARRLRPEVVLMDLQLPVLDGVAATRAIVQERLSRVLILTTFDTEDYVLDGIRAGAAGYLLKDVDAGELCAVIRRVAAGESFVQPSVAAKYLRQLAGAQHADPDPLTPRELDVLRLLARGESNRAIAETLHITESTVKSHVNSILGKLQVPNRTSAAVKAQKLLPPDL